MNAGLTFYACQADATGAHGASLEAKILLPLKSIVYGVPPHAFCQMSSALASKCCDEYTGTLKSLYCEEYLRIPDKADLQNVAMLHREVHGVSGMLDSLDFMHNGWKNCPKAWQASYKSGQEKRGPTVVLEALVDYHLWFWHAPFGYAAGSLNDLNIFNLSPLLERVFGERYIY